MSTPPDTTGAPGSATTVAALERHMLAWLDDAGWQAALTMPDPQHHAACKLWHGQGWPLIVRRTDADAAPGEVCLGLPLPPDEDSGRKVRIALRARINHIEKTAPATELATLMDMPRLSPTPPRAALAALERDAKGMRLRVFGSLAMEALTGLPYVSPTSDVDILFHPRDRRQLDDGIAVLSRHAAHLPLDGEIVFPGGAAVSWKEWRGAITNPSKVMVKELHGVRLLDTASLLALLEPT